MERILIENGCWIWQSSLNDAGYAVMSVPVNGKCAPRRVHKMLYEFINGPVEDGLCLDHLCRNRNCINPKHLEPVTWRENILRGNSMSAIHARKTHCIRGHEFDGKWRNSRRCSKCQKIRNDYWNGKKRGINPIAAI